jgi:hypothetical protein
LNFPGTWVRKSYGLQLVLYKLGENWAAKDTEWVQILRKFKGKLWWTAE